MFEIKINTKFQKSDLVIACLTKEDTQLPHPCYTEVKVLGLDNIKYIFQNDPQIHYLVQAYGKNYVVNEKQLMCKEDFIKLISRM